MNDPIANQRQASIPSVHACPPSRPPARWRQSSLLRSPRHIRRPARRHGRPVDQRSQFILEELARLVEQVLRRGRAEQRRHARSRTGRMGRRHGIVVCFGRGRIAAGWAGGAGPKAATALLGNRITTRRQRRRRKTVSARGRSSVFQGIRRGRRTRHVAGRRRSSSVLQQQVLWPLLSVLRGVVRALRATGCCTGGHSLRRTGQTRWRRGRVLMGLIYVRCWRRR